MKTTNRRYIIWSESKASASTYTELVAQEKAQNGGVSSRIESHDITSLLEAIYNETDISLLCREIVKA